MKRKFGKLLMATIMMTAVGASFTSCRDFEDEVNAEMQGRISTLSDLNKELEADLNDLADQLQEAKDSCDKRTQNLRDELNAAINGLDYVTDDQLADSMQVVRDLMEELVSEEELADELDEIKELINAKLDTATFKSEIEKLLLLIETNKNAITSINTAIISINNTLQNHSDSLANHDSRIVTLENFVNNLVIKDYQQDIDALRGELGLVADTALWAYNLAQTNAGEIARLDSLIKTLNSCNCDLEPLRQEMKDSIDAVRSELDEIIATAAANLETAKQYADSVANAVKNDLQSQINATNQTITDLKTAYDKAIEELKQEINTLKGDVAKVKEDLEDLLDKYNKLEERVEDLENRISSVVLQGAYSPVIGYFSLPTGMKSNILAAYYGKANQDFYFPTIRTVANTSATNFSFTEAEANLLGFTEERWYNGEILIGEEGNAGTLYMTINPNSVDLTNTEFKLVNSLGEEAPATLSTPEKSSKKLSFGYTRAGADNGFYEAKATISAEQAEEAKLNINLEDIKDVVKDVITIQNGVNVSNIVTTLYNSINEIADAQALEATWNDASGEHSVYSDYGLATIAVKPLSYQFFYDAEYTAMPGYHRAMNFLNNMYDRLFAAIKVRIPDADFDLGFKDLVLPEIKKIEIAELSDELLGKFKVTVIDTVTVSVPVKTDVLVSVPDFEDITTIVPGTKVWVEEQVVEVPGQTVMVPAHTVDIVLSNGDTVSAEIPEYSDEVQPRPVTIPGRYVEIGDQTVTISGDQLKIEDFTVNIDKNIETEVVVGPFEYDMSQAVKDLYGELTGSIEDVNEMLGGLEDFMDDINEMLDQFKGYETKIEDIVDGVTNAIDKIEEKVQSKLNKYLDKVNNKLCNVLNSFNSKLQPTMLVNTADGFGMLSSLKGSPTVVNSTSLTLIPTSYTAEILAPAFKKYIAVTNVFKGTASAQGNDTDCLSKLQAANNGTDLNTTLEGATRTIQFNGEKGYVYEITYSAVDYSGYISNTKYYVTIK